MWCTSGAPHHREWVQPPMRRIPAVLAAPGIGVAGAASFTGPQAALRLEQKSAGPGRLIRARTTRPAYAGRYAPCRPVRAGRYAQWGGTSRRSRASLEPRARPPAPASVLPRSPRSCAPAWDRASVWRRRASSAAASVGSPRATRRSSRAESATTRRRPRLRLPGVPRAAPPAPAESALPALTGSAPQRSPGPRQYLSLGAAAPVSP